jgi:hypothetical protein
MAHADDQFLNKIQNSVRVCSVQSTRRANSTTPEQLASRWKIGLTKVKKTLDVTTQRGTRTVAFPSLEARFRMNDRQLRYRRLNTALYTDDVCVCHVKEGEYLCTSIHQRPGVVQGVFPEDKRGRTHFVRPTFPRRRSTEHNDLG